MHAHRYLYYHRHYRRGSVARAELFFVTLGRFPLSLLAICTRNASRENCGPFEAERTRGRLSFGSLGESNACAWRLEKVMGRFPPRSYNVDSRGIRDLTGARERKKVYDPGDRSMWVLARARAFTDSWKRRRLQLVQDLNSVFAAR